MTEGQPIVSFSDLGRMSYADALDIQNKHFEAFLEHKKLKRTARLSGHFFLVEHNPVYTLGRNGSEDNLLLSRKDLNAEVFRIGRGGDVTYHGPGQVVGYPILDLEQWPMGLAKYVFLVEELIIKTLKDYGITADRTKNAPGVWLDYDSKNARKIAALGIQSSRWVTMHGFAFNINTDLDYFNKIVPCGIPDKKVTSLSKELGREVAMDEVKQRLKDNFESLFEVAWSKSAMAQ